MTLGKGDYNGNPKLPVYSHTSTSMDTQEIVNALLDPELDDEMICSMQPVNVENNVAFIVDLGKPKNIQDHYCDDMDRGNTTEFPFLVNRWVCFYYGQRKAFKAHF